MLKLKILTLTYNIYMMYRYADVGLIVEIVLLFWTLVFCCSQCLLWFYNLSIFTLIMSEEEDYPVNGRKGKIALCCTLIL